MAYGHSRFRSSLPPAGISVQFGFAVVMVAAAFAVVSAATGTPVRAFWIAPSAMTSAANIERTVSSAATSGFDAVVAPLAIGAHTDSDSFDGTAELLRQARERGLGTHLSISVNVAASAGEFPASRDHVIYQHPEWLMVPRQIAAEMLKVDTRSPAYLGQLARWTRANADRVEGVYVSPLDPAAVAYLVSAITSAVGRYAVDGLYLEAIDFPGDDFDYSRRAMELFRARIRTSLASAERSRLDEIEAIDPFAYPAEFPDEWRAFREVALTAVLEGLRTTLTSMNPSLSIAAAVRTDTDASVLEHFQAWRTWLTRGLVDRVGYRTRSNGTVIMSADGVFASTPERLPLAQAVGTGGPR